MAGIGAGAATVSALVTMGVPNAIARELASGRQSVNSIWRESGWLVAGQAAVGSLLFGIPLLVVGRSVGFEIPLYVAAIALVPLGVAFQYVMGVIQGGHRYRLLSLARVLLPATYVAAVLSAVVAGRSLSVLFVVWASALAGVTVAILRPLRQSGKSVGERTAGLRPHLIRFGVRSHAGFIAPMDSLPLDQLAVAALLSPAALAMYAVGYAFTNLPRLVAQSVGSVAYPRLVALDRGERRRSTLRYALGVALGNGFLSLALILVMPWLLPLLFGERYTGAVPVAQVLLVGTTIASVRRILSDGLRAQGHAFASSLPELSLYPVVAVLIPLMGLRFGPTGVAAAVAIGHLSSLITAAVLIRRQRFDRTAARSGRNSVPVLAP